MSELSIHALSGSVRARLESTHVFSGLLSASDDDLEASCRVDVVCKFDAFHELDSAAILLDPYGAVLTLLGWLSYEDMIWRLRIEGSPPEVFPLTIEALRISDTQMRIDHFENVRELIHDAAREAA